MAPQRRSRRGRLRYWVRGNARRQAQDSISGDVTRRVLDSYCPFCATDIRSGGPRRIVRCPNSALCGKLLPVEDTCPKCCHYTKPGDNFCRVCRTNLRNLVRGRGGLYQQLRRVPSPNRNPSPPRQEIQPDQQDENGMHSDNASDDASDSDNDNGPNNNNNNPVLGPGRAGGGFLRIALIDDE